MKFILVEMFAVVCAAALASGFTKEDIDARTKPGERRLLEVEPLNGVTCTWFEETDPGFRDEDVHEDNDPESNRSTLLSPANHILYFSGNDSAMSAENMCMDPVPNPRFRATRPQRLNEVT